ncbi:MAG: hypothetical protein ACK50P_10410, partial [Planctomycetaceae bacterium]
MTTSSRSKVFQIAESDLKPVFFSRLPEVQRASFTTIWSGKQMGKQIGFYMNLDDEQEFVSFLASTGSIAILASVQKTVEVSELNELPKLGTPFSWIVWIWNKDISVSPKVEFVKKHDYYVIDGMNSEVIEWSRSHPVDGRLRPGRVWAEMNRWSFDNSRLLIPKSEIFQKWTSRVLKWIA